MLLQRISPKTDMDSMNEEVDKFLDEKRGIKRDDSAPKLGNIIMTSPVRDKIMGLTRWITISL